MRRSRRVFLSFVPLAMVALSGSASSAAVPDGSPLSIPGYAPRVPVSALARPFSWFEPSRLHVSTSVSVGSGFGRRAEALQVTSLSYRFGAPLWMSVSMGSTWGPGEASSGRSFFLEGLDVAYRLHPSVLFQIHYRDLRSPLQLSPFAESASPWGP
jgi:hypothetical protein